MGVLMQRMVLAVIAVFALESCSSTAAPSDTTEKIQTSDYQAKILEDSVVTEAEYEQAMIADLTCIEQAGFAVRGPQWGGSPRHLLRTIRVAEADQQAFDAAAIWCDSEYLDDVESQWQEQQRPSPEEYSSRMHEYIACLSDLGVQALEGVTDPVTVSKLEQEFISAGGTTISCVRLNPNGVLVEENLTDLPEFNGPGAG